LKLKADISRPDPVNATLGAGLVAAFVDGADSDNCGYGGVIHINHVYTICATLHGSDTGIFVSIKLAKQFEDKRKRVDKYLNMVGL
jgi:hypothetical protein